MPSKRSDPSDPKPLDNSENDILLRYLRRIVDTTQSDTIRRVAKSLFTLLAREKYN